MASGLDDITDIGLGPRSSCSIQATSLPFYRRMY